MKKLSISFLFLFSLVFGSCAQNIKLPEPNKTGGKPIMEAFNARKSQREFQETELSLQTLSNLLWAANGFNRPANRTAPTSRDNQELELAVILPKGVYNYDAKENKLILVKKGDHRAKAGMQDFVATAPVNILFVSDLDKASNEQSAYIDLGFVSQNIYLFCASEGLATVVRALFDPAVLAELLELPANKKVLLTQTVGMPK